eukprot:Skav222111  [mRNA]  locus=scaffold1181:235309:235847:- [translate_table: standard]
MYLASLVRSRWPPGKENMPCPINGMFLSREAAEGKEAMEKDPDILEEPRVSMMREDGTQELPNYPSMYSQVASHQSNEATIRHVRMPGAALPQAGAGAGASHWLRANAGEAMRMACGTVQCTC